MIISSNAFSALHTESFLEMKNLLDCSKFENPFTVSHQL